MSCSIITIYNTNEPYNDEPIKELIGHTKEVTSILAIKERKELISISNDITMRIWSLNTYQCIRVIKSVWCSANHSAYQIDKDRIAVGMKFKIYIINIEKGIKEVTIEDNKRLYDVQGFILLRDKETLIALGEGECFYYYNMRTKEYYFVNTIHKDTIVDIKVEDDNGFITCGYDGALNFWKY